MKISAVVITLNEEKRLEPALRSLRDVADEIIVVDSGSKDRTVRLAENYTSRVFERPWTGYADQKNYGNSLAVHPWILSLDADERLSPELRREILELKTTDPDCNAFSMPRRVHYLGKWIRHSGWYPGRKIRLFRKEKAHWAGAYVHESLIVEGGILKLKGDLHHFTYRGIDDHVARINRFSGLAAQKLYAAGKKSRSGHLIFLPGARFLKTYVLKLGFLDGFPGFVIAVLNGYAVFIRYAKLREIWKKGERIEPFPY